MPKGGFTIADKRDVMNYKAPYGPTNINDAATPGLKGTNFGNCGTQGPKGTSPKTPGTTMRYPDNMKSTQGKR